MLRSVGRDPDEAVLAWMREFCERTQSPFFYEIAGERFGFGPPEFQAGDGRPGREGRGAMGPD